MTGDMHHMCYCDIIQKGAVCLFIMWIYVTPFIYSMYPLKLECKKLSPADTYNHMAIIHIWCYDLLFINIYK